jgi:hypothetical protein
MALVDSSDIQVHLPLDKLDVDDIPDSVTEVELDVERVIKGTLSATFSAVTLASWSTPEDTPSYIRAIGGRLAAAFIYRLRLAQDYPEDAIYAKIKYDEAMAMLQAIITGAVTLPEVDEDVDTGGHLSTGHYVVGSEPVFTMDQQF